MLYFMHNIISLIFTCYVFMLMIRVIGSWFGKIRDTKFMVFIAHYTDPYLNLFRRIIPPLGGVLDLSPILGFFVLRLLQNILLSIFS